MYVHTENGEIVEAVFFGGDRLTDERVQGSQMAMKNADSPRERLEGFISKIEDFHRLMNFLEAFFKLTYNTQYSGERGTVAYFRNVLNYRNAKGDIKNAYRAYKMLYYAILDAIIVYMFLDFFNVREEEKVIPLPENFNNKLSEEKNQWLDDVCTKLVEKWFFENSLDICASVREVLEDISNSEQYCVASKEDGRYKCHFCDKTYACVTSLKVHKKTGMIMLKLAKKKQKKMMRVQIMMRCKITF